MANELEQIIEITVGVIAKRLTVAEKVIRKSLIALDSYDEGQGRDEALDQIHSDLEEALKQISKGRWYIKGRSVDGTEYHEDTGWCACWYQATSYESEAKAQEVIATINDNQQHLPPDDRVGRLKAMEMLP